MLGLFSQAVASPLRFLFEIRLISFLVTNGSYSHMDEEEDGLLYGHDADFSSSNQNSYLQER